MAAQLLNKKYIMPHSMIQRRLEILKHINNGLNNSQIARITGHDRKFIGKIRKDLSDGVIFDQTKLIGRPPIKTNESLKDMVRSLTENNRRMATSTITDIVNNALDVPNASYGTIHTIRHSLGFNYLPPITAFPISEKQRLDRFSFCQKHINQQTSWKNVLFVDESSFYLDNSHRWVWRRRREVDQSIMHFKSKYVPKIMIFGGISYNWKTPLISIEGNVNSTIYIDECIDLSGMIPEMNSIYGVKQWFLLQDGASSHTSRVTMDYLQTYINVFLDS